MANKPHDDLFSSIISDIQTYSGDDPLLPWLRGVRNMKENLPPRLLDEKLPRFLQRCIQNFESDRRSRNDLRFLRIWLQLMDYVDDPRVLLRTMEEKKIGTKRALFYRAYALYYEKMKKFEQAEKMYSLGVQNLAEPLDEIQKSYEQFLHRVEQHKTKRIQRTARRYLSDSDGNLTHLRSNMSDYEKPYKAEGAMKTCCMETLTKAHPNDIPMISHNDMSLKERDSNILTGKLSEKENSSYLFPKNEVIGLAGSRFLETDRQNSDTSDVATVLHSDDSMVTKFVGATIVGTEAEDDIHVGLVDPTITTKKAVDAINNMFRVPLEPAVSGRPKKRRHKDHNLNCSLEVVVDENLDDQFRPSKKKDEMGFPAGTKTQELLEIFIDEDDDEVNKKCSEKDDSGSSEAHAYADYPSSSPHSDTFVFPLPKDNQSENSNDIKNSNDLRNVKSSKSPFREDTVVSRFVGAAILDEQEMENICHHGLVDPTINLKQAMDDINSMFGRPLEFMRTTRKKMQEKAASSENRISGFSILVDEDLDIHKNQLLLLNSSVKEDGYDLFEQTVFTREAMDDINKMFAMPLEF